MSRLRLQHSPPKRWLLTGFVFITAASIALAILGGARAYTPVPFWDMWEGLFNFYLLVQSGDTSVWWAQHNEHRIVLSRLLFWLDIAVFRGAGLFLIIMNYVLEIGRAHV